MNPTAHDHISQIAVPGKTKVRYMFRGGRIGVGTYKGWNAKLDKAEIEVIHPNGVVELRTQYITIKEILDANDPLMANAPEEKEIVPVVPFTVAERFRFLSELSDMVIEEKSHALVCLGDPGLGKSFTITERLKRSNLVEGDDYVLIKGFSTPKALYRQLVENNGKLIIMDDCDSVLENGTALNLLKGALDSYDKRIISWLSEADSDLPPSIDFTGRIIFISNKKIEQLDDAIASRSHVVDLTMTTDEKIERLRFLAPIIAKDIPLKRKLECVEIIAKYRHSVKELNVRTLIKATQIAAAADHTDDWQRLATYAIVAK